MLKSTHFGACSDAMQQVHGAGVKSNELLHVMGEYPQIKRMNEKDIHFSSFFVIFYQ